MKATTTKKKKNKSFTCIGEDVDFINRKVVFLTVRNYSNPKIEDYYFNVMGIIIKEKDGFFSGRFRIKYPSGNKTVVGLKNKTKDYTSMVLDLTVNLDNMFTGKDLKAIKEDFMDIPIPESAQDCEGFMAILRASDLFDIKTQLKGQAPRE